MSDVIEINNIDVYTISEARVSFITARIEPSVRDLENTYGIPKSTIHDIMIRENWHAKRSDYWSKEIDKTERSAIAKIRRERNKKLEKINSLFEKGSERLLKKFEDDTFYISVRDLNLLCRLGEFLSGEADSRHEHKVKLDKPLSEYSTAELIAMRNRIIEGDYEIIDGKDDMLIEDKSFTEISDDVVNKDINYGDIDE